MTILTAGHRINGTVWLYVPIGQLAATVTSMAGHDYVLNAITSHGSEGNIATFKKMIY